VIPETGLVVSLTGDLGAGKTLFVKGLAAGLGLAADLVTSPTFAIVNEYPAVDGPRLIHMDFYRLESENALEEVGFLDLLAMDAVLAIEWGERFAHALPADRMEIQIDRPKHAIDPDRAIEDACEPSESLAAVFEIDEKSPRALCAAATGPISLRVLEAWKGVLLAEAGETET
jgi:tRNA threonylcarbamoyladenosine biosynthesis protein TsaE